MASLPIDTPGLLAIAAALGWASGLRLYAVVFLTGLAGHLGWVQLPAGLHVLQSIPMLGASGFMDARTGWCEGCLRTLDEIADWSVMDDDEKRAVWDALAERRTVIESTERTR